MPSLIDLVDHSHLHDALRFVLSARADKTEELLPTLYQLMKVESRDNHQYAYCASKTRLHIADITNMEFFLRDGLYRIPEITPSRVQLMPCCMKDTFVDVFKLIREDMPLILGEVNLSTFWNTSNVDTESINTSLSYARVVRAMSNSTIKFSYLKDLLLDKFYWKLYWDENSASPLLFKTRDIVPLKYKLTAAIMPIRGGSL